MENYNFLELFDSQNINIIITDINGLIKKANHTFIRNYGHLLKNNNLNELSKDVSILIEEANTRKVISNDLLNQETIIEKHHFNEDLAFIFKNNETVKTDYMYKRIINTINESIVVVDLKGNVILFNKASEKFEDILRENALGKNIMDLYDVTKETSLFFKVLETGEALVNQHQIYTTNLGKRIDVMVDTYPLHENGRLIGAVSIMKDYSKIEELSKQIVDLQNQLIKKKEENSEKNPLSAKHRFNDIICISDEMKERISLAKKAAKSRSPILIHGETGTGKELFAQSIHNYGNNSDGPFIAINCAAIPDNLLEGLLFGTVKGAFSDAIDRPGLFEQAENGTIILDELNSMSLNLQSKLLRVLQENKVRRVGGSQEIELNTRLISIMNEDPLDAVKENKIRQDLFYRIGVILVEVPSLNNRKEDIPILSQMFILRFNRLLNKQITRLSAEASEIFTKYNWPGNVRELQHTIEYAMNVANKGERIIDIEHLPDHITKNISSTLKTPVKNLTLEQQLNKEEINILRNALVENNWNVSETARKLDIKRQSLQYRIRKYSLKQQ